MRYTYTQLFVLELCRETCIFNVVQLVRFLVLDEKQKMASGRRKFIMNLQDEVKIVNDYDKLEDMTSTSFSTVDYDIDFIKDIDFPGEIDKISQKILSVKNSLPSRLQLKGHLLSLPR